MKILLAENPTPYAEIAAKYNKGLEPLQSAFDAYTALGINTTPTVAELAALQETPRAFIVRMLTKRQPVSMTGGITISDEKAYDMMVKPAGVEEFITLASALPPVQVSDLESINGRLQYKKSVIDAAQEQGRLYATTPSQKDEWDQLQIIAAALNTIRQFPRMKGQSFHTEEYLKRMLLREGYAAGGNHIEVNTRAVIQFA